MFKRLSPERRELQQKCRTMPDSDEKRELIQGLASAEIWPALGERLWAGQPMLQARTGDYIVTVHSYDIPDHVFVGSIMIASDGKILRKPSGRAIARSIQSYRNSGGKFSSELTLPPLSAAEEP